MHDYYQSPDEMFADADHVAEVFAAGAVTPNELAEQSRMLRNRRGAKKPCPGSFASLPEPDPGPTETKDPRYDPFAKAVHAVLKRQDKRIAALEEQARHQRLWPRLLGTGEMFLIFGCFFIAVVFVITPILFLLGGVPK
jgi:hypothetical protein